MNLFKNLCLNSALLKALTKHGYTVPTPIQTQAIPKALAGKDLIAIAQTGTGKTAAFVLPALEFLINQDGTSLQKPALCAPRVLILTPTRELTSQVTIAITKYSSFLKFRTVSIIGGVSYRTQSKDLSKPVDILVATPGRLIDYVKRKKINLSKVQLLVLDEADLMLDMGFIDAVKYLAEQTPKTRQTLLFTATMSSRLKNLAQCVLNNPEQVEITSNETTALNIKQQLYFVDNESHKNTLLRHLLTSEDITKAIIFSATKRTVAELARQCSGYGHSTGSLHGDMSQYERNKTIAQLRIGRITILVATDVAARGIDVTGVSHVINYDMPKFAESYVHRIGRTGRAGKSGIAISLAFSSELTQVKRIERFTGHVIQPEIIQGLEPTRKPRINRDTQGFGRNHDRPWNKFRKPAVKKDFKKRYFSSERPSY